MTLGPAALGGILVLMVLLVVMAFGVGYLVRDNGASFSNDPRTEWAKRAQQSIRRARDGRLHARHGWLVRVAVAYALLFFVLWLSGSFGEVPSGPRDMALPGLAVGIVGGLFASYGFSVGKDGVRRRTFFGEHFVPWDRVKSITVWSNAYHTVVTLELPEGRSFSC